MKYDPDIHDRTSTRWRGYDYSLGGAYFITICTHDRRCVLDVPELREIIESVWRELPNRFERTKLDAFVIMPNHIHAVLFLSPCNLGTRHAGLEEALREPSCSGGSSPRKRSLLSRITGYFKTNTARRINVLRGTPGGFVWQRGFYDRVIRNDEEMCQIREYVLNNPKNWDRDKENPNRVVDNNNPP